MPLKSISLKIAYPIIIAGLFIMVAFIALNYESLTLNFYIIFVFLILYIFLFGFATGQNFASPVRKLLQSADNLSRGDLKSRSYLEGKDELGQLAHTFNRIADDLEQSRNQNDNMEKSVDLKVQARTRSLEETINALEQKVKNRTIEIQRTAADLERLRQESQVRAAEAETLKNRLVELQEKMETRPRRKRAVKKIEASQDELTL